MLLVINFHVTEFCNYRCKYCYAKWDGASKVHLNNDVVEKIVTELTNWDAIGRIIGERVTGVRINFAGGEPLILGKEFVDVVKHAKKMGFETSLITNGYSLERYPDIFGYLDMLGVSVDSLDENVCKNIGRCTKKGDYLSKEVLTALVSRARQVNPRIKIKFNTVVNKHNCKSDVAGQLQALKPDRLKILRQLPFDGKKGITDEQFRLFLDTNKQACERENVVIEDNGDITHSYIMIDPLGRFFQNGNGRDYAYSDPIYKVGVERALSQISFDIEKFLKRYNDGGVSNG